jgi:molecular chaperone DnaK
VQARNQADALIHATHKSMAALGGKLQSGEKESIDLAIPALEGAIKGVDKAAIEKKTKACYLQKGDTAGRTAEGDGAASQNHKGRR